MSCLPLSRQNLNHGIFESFLQQNECLLSDQQHYRGLSYISWNGQPIHMISKHSIHLKPVQRLDKIWLLWYIHISPKSSQSTSHSSPARVSHGMYIVGSNGYLHSASIAAIMYTISCYIGSCYNGTQLYLSQWILFFFFNLNPLKQILRFFFWDSIQNSKIFFQGDAFKIFICKLIAI